MYEKYAGKRESEFYSATILLGHWIDLRLTFFLFFVDVVDALTTKDIIESLGEEFKRRTKKIGIVDGY